MNFEWWHWILIGLTLIMAELAVPHFVLIWMGLGGLLVGIVMVFLDFGLTTQLVIWAVASVAMIFLWFRVFEPNMHKTRIGMSDAYVIGEIGLLTRRVEPFERGSVRFQKPLMGSDVWECIADEKIDANDRVKVIGMEGNLLKVGRA